MTQPLYRLVYYSRNRMAGEPAALSAEIAGILAVSRRNNTAAGVTGALMFNAGVFAQLLEGPQAAVEATFERIQRDERHGEVSLLACEPVAAPAFPSWSMGFVGSSASDAALYAATTAAGGLDLARLTGDELVETLHRLAIEDERAAA